MKMLFQCLSASLMLLIGCASTLAPSLELGDIVGASGRWVANSDVALRDSEQKALNVVKEYEYRLQRRESRDYFYSVEKKGDLIHVKIIYGFGFKGDQPIFTPDASAVYTVDDRYRIIGHR